MQPRVASVIAHVLASVTLAACGGGLADGTASSSGASTTPEEVPSAADSGTAVGVDGGADGGTEASVDSGACAPVFLGDDKATCADVWHQPCGLPRGVDPSDGMSHAECELVCGTRKVNGDYWGCGQYLADDLPGPSFSCYTCVEGRRPAGYVDPPTAAGVAGWLAHAADLERVSIDAFQQLARELAYHGAPSELLRDVARAEADEVRHTRVVGALARREGAVLSVEPVYPAAVRSLLEIALENAVEGCIRETYGALVGAWQAEHAGRADIRRAMRVIAVDETAHAELAWRVHAWLDARLTPEGRARVAGAMAKAVRELAEAASAPVAPELVTALGLPSSANARRLVEGLDAQLWACAA